MDKHLSENKAIFMKDKTDVALEECFERCNKGNNDYKSVSSRQLTCIGTSHIIKNTAL